MTAESSCRPRIGVPWRTTLEEQAGERARYEDYLAAIRRAGGEPVEVSLQLADDVLRRLAGSLDGIVLTGSPADVDPSRYGSERHLLTAQPDIARERTDKTLIQQAIDAGKPLLAICFGIQTLNVHLGGSLLQDIPSELGAAIDHDREENDPDSRHEIALEPGRVADLAGATTARVNTSHHQSVLEPGRNLRVVARAPDGVIEAIEWTGSGWIVGVQWHPERMYRDALAESLFRAIVAEAQEVSASQPR